MTSITDYLRSLWQEAIQQEHFCHLFKSEACSRKKKQRKTGITQGIEAI